MRIAQITDIHIGFDRDNPDEYNMQRLRTVLARLAESPNRPDLLLMSGDLTEFGDAESYDRLADAVSACPFPVWPMVGNHDSREPLLAAFPQTPSQGGFIHYVLELTGLRLVVLDTLEPGRHGGAFCPARAEWLGAQLAADTQTPTYIAMHHPPFESGLNWLDSSAREPWIAKFADAIEPYSQVRGIIAGHLHRTIHTLWNGVSLTVCNSVAPAVALDLTPIDPELPDNRPLITDELAGYGLHSWDGNRLVSHFECVGALQPLARYDDRLQEVVRIIQSERPA